MEIELDHFSTRFLRPSCSPNTDLQLGTRFSWVRPANRPDEISRVTAVIHLNCLPISIINFDFWTLPAWKLLGGVLCSSLNRSVANSAGHNVKPQFKTNALVKVIHFLILFITLWGPKVWSN